MEENEQNQNAGDPTGGISDITADPTGNSGANPSVSQGTPDGNGSRQPDSREDELAALKKEIRNLNRAVVDARRGTRTPNANKGVEYNEEMLGTPEGQYAVSLEVADARLRGGLEDRLKLYPEISDEDKARIRNNPWAFAGRQSWMSGDYESALDEIELTLADRIDEMESQNAKSNPQSNSRVQTANVSGNSMSESENPDDMTEEENPWTMPMDKLENLAKKQIHKLSQSK